MPLVIAPLNTDLKIVKILVDDKLKKHLESLGITINSMVRVVSCSNGNCIIQIKDGRLAIDRNVATKILVA
ncbi:MAG: ferrous iron transport protein A [Acholeplasmatales bacterium]|nr:ferrous iron transport protein A [Acholeplasmatales bacterium]